jgi:hypothetical protein
MNLPNHARAGTYKKGDCFTCGGIGVEGHVRDECLYHLRKCIEAIADEIGDTLTPEQEEDAINDAHSTDIYGKGV